MGACPEEPGLRGWRGKGGILAGGTEKVQKKEPSIRFYITIRQQGGGGGGGEWGGGGGGGGWGGGPRPLGIEGGREVLVSQKGETG